MKDYLVKAIAFEGQLRAYAVTTTDIAEEARRRHDTISTSTEALGQLLTAGVMLGTTLKGSDKITMKVNGGGPMGTVSVDTNAVGEVRGFVMNPRMESSIAESESIDRAIGSNGVFSVSKYIGTHPPFVGQVPIGLGTIEDEFSSYLNNSEQTKSIVKMGLLINADSHVHASGGIILQLLTGASADLFDYVSQAVSKIESIPQLISQGVNPEHILQQIIGAENLTVLETMPVRFQCQCSEERITNAIVSLGKEEIKDMIHTDGQAEATCHYCNETYFYTKEDLEKLMDEAN